MLVILTVISGIFQTSWAQEKSSNEMMLDLFALERAVYYSENPLAIRPDGIRVSKMPSVLPSAYARQETQNRQFLKQLKLIDRVSLNDGDKLNYDLFGSMIENRILYGKHRLWRLPLQSDSGFHSGLSRSWQRMRFNKIEDFEFYIERLRDYPRYFDEQIENMRLGMVEGYTMPRIVLDGLMPNFDTELVETADESGFFEPLITITDAIGIEDQARLRSQAKDVILTLVIPSFEKLRDFMVREYYPASRQTIGVSMVSGGKALYEDMIRYYTTLEISPEDVHALGLVEVARIRTEMEAIISEVKFEGSFQDFITFLRTDPRFYAKTPKELLMYASYIAKRIDHKMPSLFTKLPRQPYGVEAVPAAIAPNYTTGRYSGSPLSAPRGGEYWVNTYKLEVRPLYALPALTLHESVPGHHHQNALRMEMKNLPAFRNSAGTHAFGEGWGLYCEKLGIEIGIYETPYEDFGRLSYEMWRALRLVVDTGMHYMDMSRDEAIKLMEENSALSKHNIRTEIDRYIAWPGQALAYKMGELKILELRTKAKSELGKDFDIRTFNDAVLEAGSIPLGILEAQIERYIVREKVKMH